MPFDLKHKPTAREARQVRLARRVRDHLEKSLAARFSLEQFAASMDISPRTLREHFKNEFGCSPSQYLATLRVRRAEQLLRSCAPIKQIAAEAGFFDQAHLNRHFKRITGKTPAQYLAERLRTRN